MNNKLSKLRLDLDSRLAVMAEVRSWPLDSIREVAVQAVQGELDNLGRQIRDLECSWFRLPAGKEGAKG